MTAAKKSRKRKPGIKPAKKMTGSSLALTGKWSWMRDSRFLVPLSLYILILFIWRANVFEGMALNISPDRISGMSFRRIVAMWLSHGIFPFWNPYFYGGMAMFETFQSSWLFYPMLWITEGFIPDTANPGFFNGGLAWLLFFGSPVDFLLFHHLLGAVGIAFLVRRFGGNGWVQLLAGVAFLLSPQLVVLPDVGHGSKFYAMCWLPWLLLALDNALEKPGFLSFSGLAATFALLMSTQHIQVAYYGYMLAGLWWLARQIRNGTKKESSRIGKETGIFLGGGLLGIAATSLIYLNTLKYSTETIRGVEGVSWEYATNWSYHPLESISMFVPDFFGFGGRDYWGYLPFTDMPLYWGVPIAILALTAVLTVRNWRVTTLTVAGLLAWITSFGKFAPILYRPFYDILPYFNKFRVPMMIHILVLLSAILLAGFGLQKIFDLAGGEKSQRDRIGKGFLRGGIVFGSLLLLSLLLTSWLQGAIGGWIQGLHPGKNENVVLIALRSVHSLELSLLYAALTCFILFLGIRKNLPAYYYGVLLTVLLLVDLAPTASRLLHPSNPAEASRYFVEDDIVRTVKSGEKTRLLPLDTVRPMNTWGALGVELETGYTGSKPATYGYLEENNLLTTPNILSVMNVHWVYSTRGLQGMKPTVQGRTGYLYYNPSCLPRVFLRTSWEIIGDTEAALKKISDPTFDPVKQLVLDRAPENVMPGEAVPANVSIASYTPNEVKINVVSEKPAILVLLDGYSQSGWKALVNGKETIILRAFGMFRAVEVPGGESDVVFRYKPPFWKQSLVLTIAAWLLIIALFITGLVKRKKRGSSVQ